MDSLFEDPHTIIDSDITEESDAIEELDAIEESDSTDESYIPWTV
jgi:hypothetical protein